MIGIVGASDSVEMMATVAEAEGVLDRLILSPYTTVREAPSLAQALDPACHLLLFTGRVPYLLARQSGGLTALLDYVPHSGKDLYRILIQLLESRQGRLPRLSLDTIERADADETFGEIGRPRPEHLIVLDSEAGVPEASAVAAAHIERYRGGDVEACLTCIREVHVQLQESGVEAYRVTHTRSAIRDAVHRGLLLDRLAQTRRAQVAVVLVEAADLRDEGGPDRVRLARERLELGIRRSMLDYAERLRGSLTTAGTGTFLIHTTRGAIEARSPNARDMPVLPEPPDVGVPLTIGLGIGLSVADAQEQARRALTLSRDLGRPHAIVDGAVLELDGGGAKPRYRLRETSEPVLELSARLGLGPFALARLVEALGRLDPANVTARELAATYGIGPRSARRLLARLAEAGLASEAGRASSLGAGRPQRVFRVQLDQLVGLDGRRDRLSGDPSSPTLTAADG